MEPKGDPEYWEARYRAGDKPWDTGKPSPELMRTVDGLDLAGGRVLEVGCGSGTNAIWMAEGGLDVVAVDLAPTVVAEARRKAAEAGVTGLEIVEGDFFAETPFAGGNFDFVYDRGAFHHHGDGEFRVAFAEKVWCALKAGGHWLTLCGSTDDEGPGGPPRLTAADIVNAAEPRFRILDLHAMEMPESGEGRLGWSALMQRREPG